MCKKTLFLVSFLLVLCLVGSVSAANYYISPSGSSGNSGHDWNNALRQLPSSLSRGYTYYFADGSYNGYTFNDSPSATYITIKKATAADHGTNTGWQSSYGDGIAFFGNCTFSSTSYIIFDGRVEDGFTLIKQGVGGSVVTVSNSSHITLRNCDLDGNFATLYNDSATSHTNGACKVVYIGTSSYVTVENCKLHDAADDGFEIHNADNLLIAGNEIYNLYGCGTDGGCGGCYNGHSDGIEIFHLSNSEFRANFIYDVRSTAAFISGNWTTDPANDSSNVTLVNNIFYSPETGFCIYIDDLHNITLVHNIFWGVWQGRYGGLSMGTNVTDMDMYNNIILSMNYSHKGATYNPAEHRGDYNLFGYSTGEYPEQAHDIVNSNPRFENMYGIYGSARREVVPEDFRITRLSAARDAAADMGITEDFFGSVRPRGSAYDIGAYEYSSGLAGDINNDCVVDIVDLKIIMDNWLVGDFVLTGLVSSYRFEGDAKDSVGGNDGTEVGDPVYAAGLHGKAISLDGSGDYVNCPNDPSFDISSAITLSVLIKGTSSNYCSLVVKVGSWDLIRSSGDGTFFHCSGVGYIEGLANINDNQWHHIAAVYDGSKLYLYVDGELDASMEATGSLDISTSDVWIGGDPLVSFNGLIDDVRIYDRALSKDELKILYTGPVIDLVNDHSIDFKDFAVLAEQWLLGPDA